MEYQENNQFDRLSYALGMSMGNNFKSSGIEKIVSSDFADGVAAVYEGAAPKMSYDEAKVVIQSFFSQLQEKQNAAMAEMARVNAEAGKAFLAENAKRSEGKTTASGRQYEVIAEGDGNKPAANNTVKVHYTGSLIDGTVFDSSVQRGEPAVFGVSQVIPGWVEALQMMTVGSKWRLFIPSELAYGANGAGNIIGPNATLIYEVELLGIEG